MDVGRLTLASDLVVVLFGTCGQARFWPTSLAVCRGAAGAVVLVDARRLADCFAYLDLFERDRMPFVVAINEFDGSPVPAPVAVREALAIDPRVPLVKCDARSPTSTRQVLAIAAEYLLGWQPFPDLPVR
jgi:signal recognition particle receptor subunit beta